MDLAGILRAAIFIGGFIAAATGVIAVVGVLQLLRGAGIDRMPPISRTSIVAHQREVDARLRARYLQRRPARPVDARPAGQLPKVEAVDGADDVPATWSGSQPAILTGSLADEPAG
jgi:hypothetical protein